jgi:hypothetical protein
MVINLFALERFVYFAGPIAAGLLLARLWRENLLGRYRCFGFYLLWLLVEVFVALGVDRRSGSYFPIYAGFETITWIAQFLVILELFSLVVNQYPGIARTGRKFIWFAFGLAVAASLVLSAVQQGPADQQFPILQQYLLVSRVVAFTLLIFLLLILAFLFYFPVQLSRNVVFYTVGYSIYFGARALTRLAGILLGPDQLLILSIISMCVVLACLTFWILFLNRAGEHTAVSVAHQWTPDQARVLVDHLDSINATLLKAGRE